MLTASTIRRPTGTVCPSILFLTPLMFGWLKNRRRRKLAARPVPDAWRAILAENVPHALWLTDAERQRLYGITHVLVAEKYWEGCNGLALTEEMQVTIAAQAALLILGLDGEFFDRLVTILLYPTQYLAPQKEPLGGGAVLEGYSERLGEAWNGGPVILSWPDVLEGGRYPTDGRNLVFHEFAHVLDGGDHFFDGTPELLTREHAAQWRDVMTAEFRRHIRAIQEGRFTLLDRYGAQSEAEFFAVATECFFEKPKALATRHPELYDVLRTFYRQDPQLRVP